MVWRLPNDNGQAFPSAGYFGRSPPLKPRIMIGGFRVARNLTLKQDHAN